MPTIAKYKKHRDYYSCCKAKGCKGTKGGPFAYHKCCRDKGCRTTPINPFRTLKPWDVNIQMKKAMKKTSAPIPVIPATPATPATPAKKIKKPRSPAQIAHLANINAKKKAKAQAKKS